MALRYLGLMSGTSLDGVDAALVQVGEEPGELTARLEAFLSVPYSPEQRNVIKAGLAGGARELCRLNVELGEWLAAAALELLARAGLTPAVLEAVGSHGQTLWHEPPTASAAGATLQLGEPAVIAERLGVSVISDFRARDVAAGGHGAPLVPLVDGLLFAAPDRTRALQNIGGIANVTLVPPAGSERPIIAFDTGPGVAVIDGVVEILSGGAETYDEDGRKASAGTADATLLEHLLEDPYFRKPPPKSTGRELFGEAYSRSLIDQGREFGLTPEADLVATATALTARSIAQAYRFLPAETPVDECIVSGGGARNPALMQMLAEELAPVPVTELSALGWDPDAREAVAFAILAHLFLTEEPANVPSVTGAIGPRVLGKLSPP